MSIKKEQDKYRLKTFLQKLLICILFFFLRRTFIVDAMFDQDVVFNIIRCEMNCCKIAIFAKYVKSILTYIHHFVSFASNFFISILTFSYRLSVFSFAKRCVDVSWRNHSSILEFIFRIHISYDILFINRQKKFVRERRSREFERICQ